MGSTLKKHPLKFIPTMHNNGFVGTDEMEIYDGAATDHGWEFLRKELKNRGYIEGCTLFDVPYDGECATRIPQLNICDRRSSRQSERQVRKR